MDTLMISAIMKMDMNEGDLVLDAVKKLSIGLNIDGPAAVEVLGKTALYVAVTNSLGRIPEQDPESAKANRRFTLVTRLADYLGCSEAQVMKELEADGV